ncbi:MAG: hypothetical protein ABFS19_11170 [Thermodesulfobacteriota bacterium]
MIDDSSNVEAIIKRFAEDSGFSLNEAEVSDTRFLGESGRRRIITMHEPE